MAAFHHYSQQRSVLVLTLVMERCKVAEVTSEARVMNVGLQQRYLQQNLQLRMMYL